MTLYEFFAIYNPLFVLMSRNGVNIDDAMHVGVYKDYIKLKEQQAENDMSEREIYTFLSKEYRLTPIKIKNVIERLNEEINI